MLFDKKKECCCTDVELTYEKTRVLHATGEVLADSSKHNLSALKNHIVSYESLLSVSCLSCNQNDGYSSGWCPAVNPPVVEVTTQRFARLCDSQKG